MGLLENKVALITGAGRGIGKAIAMRFAQEGCNIAFTDIALNDVVLETEQELKAMGVEAKAYASNAANFEARADNSILAGIRSTPSSC